MMTGLAKVLRFRSPVEVDHETPVPRATRLDYLFFGFAAGIGLAVHAIRATIDDVDERNERDALALNGASTAEAIEVELPAGDPRRAIDVDALDRGLAQYVADHGEAAG